MSRATGIKSPAVLARESRRSGREDLLMLHGLSKPFSHKAGVQFTLGSEIGGSSFFFCRKCPEVDLSAIDLDLGSEPAWGSAYRADSQKPGCGVVSLRLGAVLVVDRVGSQAQIDPAVVGAVTIDVINETLRPLASHEQPRKPVRRDGFPKDPNPHVPPGFIKAAALARVPAGQHPKFAKQRAVANVGGSLIARNRRTPATDCNCGPTTTTGGGGVHNWSLEPVGLVRSQDNLAHVDGYPKGNAKDGKGEDAEGGLHGSVLWAAGQKLINSGSFGGKPCGETQRVVSPTQHRCKFFESGGLKAAVTRTSGPCGLVVHGAIGVVHTSALHLGGLALGGSAQHRPVNVGAEVFAGDGAIRGALNGWAVLGGDSPPVKPVPDVLLLNAYARRKGCLPANEIDGSFEWFHARRIQQLFAFVQTLVVCGSQCLLSKFAHEPW